MKRAAHKTVAARPKFEPAVQDFLDEVAAIITRKLVREHHERRQKAARGKDDEPR